MSSTAELQAELSPFWSTQAVVAEPVSTMSLMFFIYGTITEFCLTVPHSSNSPGVYVMVFGKFAALRCRESQLPKSSQFYTAGVVVLFVLNTINNIAEIWLRVRQAAIDHRAGTTKELDELLAFLHGDALKTGLIVVTDNVPLIMNVVADAMLIHRCYVIWGYRKIVGYSLGVLSFMINVTGLASNIMSDFASSNTYDSSREHVFDVSSTTFNAYYYSNAVFNSILTLITGNVFSSGFFERTAVLNIHDIKAGRIWWITRQARASLGKAVQQRYKTIVVIIGFTLKVRLESGMIYPFTLIFVAVFERIVDPSGSGLIPVDLSPMFVEACGLAPTLVIIRAQTNKTLEHTESTAGVSTLHFASRAVNETSNSDHVEHTGSFERAKSRVDTV
ncbi:hypothetical protein V5O48_006600 [Marasmius crinis-equi]|uniref:Gustatory receptor n=1 Tax=Marasmius crinis-equi TaxID=585013 RepID=A0ABR3FJL8_9AGAR